MYGLGWWRGGQPPLDDLGTALAQLVEQAGEFHREATLRETKAARQAWKDWLLEDEERGSRNAHNFTQLRKEWQPPVAKDEHGQVSTDPHHVMAEECAKYRQLWEVSDIPNSGWDPGDREHTDDP